MKRELSRRRGFAAPLVLAGALLAAATPAARAQTTLTLFEARAAGSVGSFSFFAPEAVFPQVITGGMLESTGLASSSPRGFGMAGLLPVPAATSVHLLVPEVIPGTDIPIPEDGKEAVRSIDFSSLPHSCQASFPPVREGDEEAFCGGPYQRDDALGFTAGSLGGHVTAEGSLDEPLSTATVSTSRAADLEIPGLQATVHDGWSRSVTGLNDDGVPQGQGVVEIDRLSILNSLVRLEGIRSETVVATDGTEQGTAARSELVVRGAWVAGVPVVLGPDGVSVNKEAVPNSDPRPLAEVVETALASAGGMQIRLVPAPPAAVEGGTVQAQSGAVEITYESLDPTPMDVTQRFGYTLAVVNALSTSEEASDEDSTGLLPEQTLPAEEGTSDPGAPPPAPVEAEAETPEAEVPAPVAPASEVPASAPGTAEAALPEPLETLEPGADAVAGRTDSRFGDQALLQPVAVDLSSSGVEGLYGGAAGVLVLGLVLVGLVLRLAPGRSGRAPAGPDG